VDLIILIGAKRLKNKKSLTPLVGQVRMNPIYLLSEKIIDKILIKE
jgi:hypothetical protein